MEHRLPLPIGRTDYKKICDNNYYVDKTLLIKDIIDDATDVFLFTRPRRFGKTLNMDMLRTFFEKTGDDTSRYFSDKKIWAQGEKYRQYQGKYPVIFMSLKDAKAAEWQDVADILKQTVIAEYARHCELENSSAVSKADAAFYQRIVTWTASNIDYMFSLQVLSRMLHEHYGIAPLIIIDEYDTPIQEGYLNGYYKQAVEFIRNFFSAALKDNSHMTMSILTGILRVAKESIFSGLNNIQVYSVLDKRFSSYFGFMADEVQVMAEYYGAAGSLSEIKDWYDGYKFGDTEIYNPWSVLNYFKAETRPRPFWVQTSGNSIINELVKTVDDITYANLKKLLSGETVESVVETNIIYPTLRDRQTNIFGFLLMTGYLKSTETTINERGAYVCLLCIPNKEIKSVYSSEVLNLFTDNVGETTVGRLQRALLQKDVQAIKTALGSFLLKTISYYDGLGENYYHGLLLGLTAIMETDYFVLSNRESGEGRYDIQLRPKQSSLPGIIIEIKAAVKADAEKLEQLAQSALAQIETKQYDVELRTYGVTDIYKYGIAFYNKKVEIVTN